MRMSFDLKSQKTLLLFVLLSTVLVYVSCLRYEFTYDDNSQIVLNPAITSTAYIPEYFTKHVWAIIDPGLPLSTIALCSHSGYLLTTNYLAFHQRDGTQLTFSFIC